MSQHQKRDGSVLRGLDFVAGVCLAYLLRDMPKLDAVAIFVGALAAISGLRYFIDQSVRNFYLHRLDWEDATSDS